jgi:hypothetical protein
MEQPEPAWTAAVHRNLYSGVADTSQGGTQQALDLVLSRTAA